LNPQFPHNGYTRNLSQGVYDSPGIWSREGKNSLCLRAFDFFLENSVEPKDKTDQKKDTESVVLAKSKISEPGGVCIGLLAKNEGLSPFVKQ
jgi:hypothetical protein